jgi:hypothetical protein
MRMVAFTVVIMLSIAAADGDPAPSNYTYAVVISKTAYADAGWKAVADSLLKKHSRTASRLFTWTSSVNEVKTDLAAFMPTYIGFIARPVTECNTAFVAAASRLSRALDSDPYGDAYWGVITGFQASDALRAISESLLIKTVILGSNGIAYEPPLQRYYQGLGMPCESYTKTDYLFPNTNGQVYSVEQRPESQQDRVNLMVKWLNAATLNISVSGKGTIAGTFDCLITGGHGNVNVWQMHYSDAGTEGYLRSSNGQLTGAPYSGSSIAINSPTPKVYWHASNCLMASPDNINNWVYAAFHTGHAVQLFGFIPEASTGDEFMAWGLFDRTTKFAGRYTLPQSHFISNNNAQFELLHSTGLFNLSGVRSYLDATLIYGDPAADVTFYSFGDSARSYKESFTYTTNAQGTTTFEYAITAMTHALQFGQGYCYQFRPVFFMPVRIDAATVSVVKNDGSTAEITDNLVLWELLRSGQTLQKGSTKTLRWTATLLNQSGIESPAPTPATPDLCVQPYQTARNKAIQVTCRNVPAGATTLSIVTLNGKSVFNTSIMSAGKQRQSFVIPLPHVSGVNVITIKGQGIEMRKTVVRP